MYPVYQSSKEDRKTNPLVSVIKSVIRVGRDFCLQTSMHGFNHIASPRRHLVERLLWALVTAAAIWGAVDISLGQWQRYNDNPTVVTLEKDFRSWRFSMPAITACDENRVKVSKLPQVIKNLWNVDPDNEKYSYYVKFITTVANSDLFHLEGYQEFKDDESLNVDLLQLVIDVMPDLQVKPIWSETVVMPWIPVITENGACFATNSLALANVAFVKPNPNDTKIFPLCCKYSSLTCSVILEVTANCNFYIHSSYDVLDITVPPSRVVLTLNRITTVSVMETRCGKGVKELSPRRRGCLYTDEPTDSNSQVYSTNTCRLSCRNKLAMKLCGCKPFYYFYQAGPTCTPAGMACLSLHAHALVTNDGVRCACAQQCTDAAYKELTTEDQYWGKGPFVNRGSVRFVLQAPRTRYTREIVFHFQDLVVSFGGAAGLFLGASFISFVEIFYFLLERFLKVVMGEETKKEEVTEVKPTIPYEETRIKALTTLLENQKRYDDTNFNYYKY